MNKQSLLAQLTGARRRAEAAHLELVVHSAAVAELEAEGKDATGVRLQRARWKMRELKHLREMDWILDQLDA